MPKPVTIRRSLLLAFAGVVLVLTLVLLGVTLLTARSAAEEQAAQLIERTLGDVRRSSQQYFQPVERVLSFATAWREQEQLAGDDELQALFNAIVTAAPQISAVRIEPYGAWSPSDFETDPVRWSEPGPLAGDAGAGVTAYAPVDLPSDESALVAVDVPLDSISDFTRGLEVTPRGKVMMLYWDEAPPGGGGPAYVVIGLPSDPAFDRPEARREALLKRGSELGLPYLADAIRAFGSQRARAAVSRAAAPRHYPPMRFESRGEAWWLGFREYDLDGGVRMADAVFVPESDLLANRASFRWFILGAGGLAALLAIGLALWLARRAGRPIEALVAGTERMRRGDFGPGEPIETQILEVRRLAEAHEEMRGGLAQLMRLEHDLQVARSIQQATFPSQMPTLAGYRLHGHSLPAEDTGGDTYDVIGVRRNPEPGNDKLTQGESDLAVLVLADATGHGIGPALSVSQVRAMLRMAVRLEADLVGVVREMNEQLCADLPPGRFISAWFGLLDPADHTLTTFSAGQGPILIYRAAEDRFERYGGNAPPLGLMEITIELPPPTRLAPGDWYVVLSDGFHEALDADGEVFGEERIQDLLRSHAAEEPAALLAALHAAVDAYTAGAPPDDDRTCVIVKRV